MTHDLSYLVGGGTWHLKKVDCIFCVSGLIVWGTHDWEEANDSWLVSRHIWLVICKLKWSCCEHMTHDWSSSVGRDTWHKAGYWSMSVWENLANQNSLTSWYFSLVLFRNPVVKKNCALRHGDSKLWKHPLVLENICSAGKMRVLGH